MCLHVNMTDDNDDFTNKPNPAVEKFLSMPPALLEEVATNPESIGPIARAMTLKNMHDISMNLHLLPAAQKIAFVEMTAKLGNMFPQKQLTAVDTGPGFSVNINFSSAPKQKTVTVEKVVEAVASEED